MRLIIRIKQIKGHCPVYQEGDTFVLEEGYILQPGPAGRICMHSLASLMPYYVALAHGVDPISLGLSPGDPEVAYVQCLDPMETTGGGTVLLAITRQD
ncbi:MAG: TIGR04076 family protein [Deltaproteobacteria bacterium]|nr:TIGR04076 family protein [Deltaproteobacteria bacterium]MBW1952442.1 TIGR04076 family protein [Deltaproteobacteria bacterium]MBW1986686.1 TIGR04076 family protein [Deltaproteobacteria bacterium]MBW2134893.1 TIGR04076 family protein [Deltaproteobacteria bacterium]